MLAGPRNENFISSEAGGPGAHLNIIFGPIGRVLFQTVPHRVPEGEGPDGLSQVLFIRVHMRLMQSCIASIFITKEQYKLLRMTYTYTRHTH